MFAQEEADMEQRQTSTKYGSLFQKFVKLSERCQELEGANDSLMVQLEGHRALSAATETMQSGFTQLHEELNNKEQQLEELIEVTEAMERRTVQSQNQVQSAKKKSGKLEDQLEDAVSLRAQLARENTKLRNVLHGQTRQLGRLTKNEILREKQEVIAAQELNESATKEASAEENIPAKWVPCTPAAPYPTNQDAVGSTHMPLSVSTPQLNVPYSPNFCLNFDDELSTPNLTPLFRSPSLAEELLETMQKQIQQQHAEQQEDSEQEDSEQEDSEQEDSERHDGHDGHKTFSPFVSHFGLQLLSPPLGGEDRRGMEEQIGLADGADGANVANNAGACSERLTIAEAQAAMEREKQHRRFGSEDSDDEGSVDTDDEEYRGNLWSPVLAGEDGEGGGGRRGNGEERGEQPDLQSDDDGLTWVAETPAHKQQAQQAQHRWQHCDQFEATRAGAGDHREAALISPPRSRSVSPQPQPEPSPPPSLSSLDDSPPAAAPAPTRIPSTRWYHFGGSTNNLVGALSLPIPSQPDCDAGVDHRSSGYTNVMRMLQGRSSPIQSHIQSPALFAAGAGSEGVGRTQDGEPPLDARPGAGGQFWTEAADREQLQRSWSSDDSFEEEEETGVIKKWYRSPRSYAQQVALGGSDDGAGDAGGSGQEEACEACEDETREDGVAHLARLQMERTSERERMGLSTGQLPPRWCHGQPHARQHTRTQQHKDDLQLGCIVGRQRDESGLIVQYCIESAVAAKARTREDEDCSDGAPVAAETTRVTVFRRYSEFAALRKAIRHRNILLAPLPMLPPRNWACLSHTAHDRRQHGLQQFLRSVAVSPECMQLLEVREFLGIADQYDARLASVC
jgi:hypothetical protein